MMQGIAAFALIRSMSARMVDAVAVKLGQAVVKCEKLLSLEAMKMESTVYAQAVGVIEEILVKPGTQIQSGDLLIQFA